MKKQHSFITSLVMWIGLSVLIVLSYSLFLWAIWYDDGSVRMLEWMLAGLFMVILPTILPFTNAQRFFTVVTLDKNKVTQKLFGILLLITGLRELFYRARKDK